MEQRLSLVTLGVGDLQRSANFYEQGLGWQRHPGPDGVVFFQLAGMILALWPRTELAADAGIEDGAVSASGFGGVALAHNCRSRAEVDAVLAEAGHFGAAILKPAKETFWGGYSGYFGDPDGHVWEVAHNPFWTIADDGRVTMPDASAGT
ncbi:VOC family protein [Tepidamorphus sp. 3E244]|uniref:VOC family protein n=1 Tax=Tepidamorphus sp. 3E244 TaxID=3385498 RepID=UPI0038FCD063